MSWTEPKSMRRTPLVRGTGRKTKANKRANAKLKIVFEGRELTTCELGYPNCTRGSFLTWAHGRKRRKLQAGELETLVILACINCHNRIENLGPEGMLAIVESVIAERGWTVKGLNNE